MDEHQLREAITRAYGEAARRAAAGTAGCGCCAPRHDRGDQSVSSLDRPRDDPEPFAGPKVRGSCGAGPITSSLYSDDERDALPVEAVNASLGCGNPTALVDLRPGETVLDLGSGGGIDVLLSARRVGPTGKAYGLDVTDDMLALARANQRRAGTLNAEFLRGEIEHIPLPDDSVDVIISNCVINLSADKDRVLAEAFRVLKPGGRFAVADVIVRGEMPAGLRDDLESWTGCAAGALQEGEYRDKLARAGFEGIVVDTWGAHGLHDAPDILASAFVCAKKPL